MRYRIAFCGFSEFEYRAMRFAFLHPTGTQDSEFHIVDTLEESDFAVVDADSELAVKAVLQVGFVARGVFVGATAPPNAAAHLPRPIDTHRILRTLDDLTSGQTAPSAFRDVPLERVFPTLDDVVDGSASPPPTLPDIWLVDIPSEPSSESAPAPSLDAPPNAAPIAFSPLPPDAPAVAPTSTSGEVTNVPAHESDLAARRALQSLAKAAARAAARRARLASLQREHGNFDPLRDVLVLDADRNANSHLCALLERFGFEPRAVFSVAQADAELVKRPYAAVFLDVALDDIGVELLRRIRALPEPIPHPAPAVLMVKAHLDPAERVRAALAGVTAPLIKPLARGDVARALESSGVILPSDARRL